MADGRCRWIKVYIGTATTAVFSPSLGNTNLEFGSSRRRRRRYYHFLQSVRLDTINDNIILPRVKRIATNAIYYCKYSAQWFSRLCYNTISHNGRTYVQTRKKPIAYYRTYLLRVGRARREKFARERECVRSRGCWAAYGDVSNRTTASRSRRQRKAGNRVGGGGLEWQPR